ncbi:MAG: hypothetical protein SGJ17_04285 [Hyphomicrobiales bacterium]|nr:hypothetical protein [Hyphomicrobiales bacterium]
MTLVSNDAVNLGEGQNQPGQPAPLYAASTARLVFPVRISLSRETIAADGRTVKLTPGMSVSAEVKTGDRRVIEYLLSPLLKMKDEAFRER